MKEDCIDILFSRLNSANLSYGIFGDNSFIKTPRPTIKLQDGRNELRYIREVSYPAGLIEKIRIVTSKAVLKSVCKTARSAGFYFYGSRNRTFSYFIYDVHLGLVNLIIFCADTMPPVKKIRRFFISHSSFPEDLVKKSFWGKGRLICFVSPEGGGKTSMTSSEFTVLEKYPVVRNHGTFSSFRDSKLYRVYDLTKKIVSIYISKLLGSIILLDRYIYLTFRDKPLLRKIIFKFAPEPDMVFIMKAPFSVLKKRRGPLCKPEEEVMKIYSLFEAAKNKTTIQSEKSIEENLGISTNIILKLFDEQNNEAREIRRLSPSN